MQGIPRPNNSKAPHRVYGRLRAWRAIDQNHIFKQYGKNATEILRGRRGNAKQVAQSYKLTSARTEGLIKALGRDLELHGPEQLDTDRARFYAELALMTLLELVRDYRRHKLLHRALHKIAPQLGIDVKELLKAYPDNRRVVHTQFLSGTKLRITVKGRHIYEVQEAGGSVNAAKIV